MRLIDLIVLFLSIPGAIACGPEIADTVKNTSTKSKENIRPESPNNPLGK